MTELERNAKAAAGRRVTLSDIAEAAQVSRATVSLVLRNSSSIPERTRAHVMKHAHALGYVYNRGAASLRTASTHIVGLVVHDVTNPYFAEIVAVIQRELAARNRMAFLGDTHDSPQAQEAFVATLREYNVDGVIMSPAAGTDPQWLEQLRRWRLPCVLYSRTIDGAGVDSVSGDNFAGMREQTGRLIELGHDPIAMIGANETISTGRDRLRGYIAALEEAGRAADPDLIVACPATREAGHDAMIRLLRSDKPPTAVVCFNDVLAFGAMLALQNLGLKVGRDVSVTGYDDIAEAVLWRPALTTQRLSCETIGKEAVRLLLRRLEEPDAAPESVKLPPDLRLRGTALAPPTAARRAAIRKAALAGAAALSR